MGATERELCSGLRGDGAAVPSLTESLPWFAIVSKPQHERAVHDALLQKNMDSFLPTYWAARRWSDRVKRLHVPLFAGYVFCRFEYAKRVPVLRTPGVRSIVCFGSEIVSIPDGDIDRIKLMVASGCCLEPWPFLNAGQRVRVHDGPLIGLEGLLTEFRGTCRVVVSLELLQRSVAVQFSRDQITPL